MQKTKIEWVKNKDGSQGYTWNPIVGCKHGCPYCYARRMNDRFKWIKKWDEPEIFWDRINQPLAIRKPSKIFVCSMSDLFGDWVEDNWIKAVLAIVKICPQHTFQFLTKNPKRYWKFDFPKNVQLGVTITGESHKEDTLRVVYFSRKELKKYYKFYSIEPLLGHISPAGLKFVDLVIIGAQTGPDAVKPKKEWIDSIKHPNIFYKNNIKKYLK